MEHWIGVDIQRRREELLAQAAHARIIRMLESGRSSSLRGRIADSADSLSQLLAGVARVMRKDEA
jgi:hypothetical protein